MTVFSVDYLTNETMEPRTEIVRTEEVKDYLEEYVPIIHKYLAEKLGLDPREVKILDWEYLGKQ